MNIFFKIYLIVQKHINNFYNCALTTSISAYLFYSKIIFTISDFLKVSVNSTNYVFKIAFHKQYIKRSIKIIRILFQLTGKLGIRN